LIRSSTEIVRSIGDFNSLCSFGGGNVKSPMCFGATVTAVVIFRYPTASLGRFHAAQTQPAASLRLLSQPTWNDARGAGLA
jgi:hypothetical protein